NEVWANLICDRITGTYWNPYTPYLDGVMTEMFATGYSPLPVSSWENQLKQVDSLVSAGKGAVLIGQGTKTDTTLETFALGSYLLVTDSDRITFRYSQSKAYSQWWSYANF